MTNNINIRHLRAFIEVARESSYRRASETLCLTQASLSTTINQLEQHLGVKLFNRTTRKVSLTNEGELFLINAKRTLSEFDFSLSDMQSRAKHKKGHVTIAAAPAALAYLLPNVIDQFIQLYPQINLTVREETADNVEYLLRSKKIDFGLQGKHNHNSNFQYELVHQDYYGIISADEQAQESGSIETTDKVSWEVIKDHNLLCMTENTSIQSQLNALKHYKTHSENRIIESNKPGFIVDMVERGVGIAVLPLLTISSLMHKNIKFQRLEKPEVYRDFFLIKDKDRTLSPTSSCLYEMIIDSLKFESL
ncbi:LysR family transcriptional regulator [Amphritea sp. 2_MG-2023]|uniref:LysR family transcriptional regulator n=1 Tax=Amphritea TaxID=515417 RepID=UPI001C075926|nr:MULTISPECIES: LysR family transcriptional regulator [Amphritea]MBU2966744.1 LysR family transcriptional regulator [Amphritea atlantica]MDO6418991.1 LysR family transcriptional regulator [Amphritea sp. 2_MG-2023]